MKILPTDATKLILVAQTPQEETLIKAIKKCLQVGGKISVMTEASQPPHEVKVISMEFRP